MAVAVKLDKWIAADQRVFSHKKKLIHGALQGETGIIDGITEDNKEDTFYMLMFCLCVPQSKAIKAEEAIDKLRKQGLYTEPMSLPYVVKTLAGLVRFHPTKAKRLMEAKITFTQTGFWNDLKRRYSDPERDLNEVRDFLIDSVNGIGMKLASHFMRNVGMGGLAILDVHVIDGLKKRGVIEVDKVSSSIEYLEIEQIMMEYADKVGITLDELDLLLWSEKTGYVFK